MWRNSCYALYVKSIWQKNYDGNLDLGDIETTGVENYNGVLRERTGGLVRKTKCFSKRKADAGMFALCVSILLEFHKRVQKKNFPCNVGRIGRSPVDMARIFLFQINYLKLGHYLKSDKRERRG